MPNSTDDIFDFQAYLQSDGLSQWRDVQKVESIIRSVSASISIIGSAAIIWHILKSHKGLSWTYHRLVFGLCVSDLMVSFGWAINSTPKEVQYIIPYASGNLGTCTAQGIFFTLGIVMATFYNCSICFYYLAIITYNKKDEYIKGKLEPWFHSVPIILAIGIVITGLILNQFNSNGIVNTCYMTSYNPPHCWGVANGIIPEGFTIPCGRGDTKSGNLFRFIMYLLPVTITPAIIIGTMVTMYRTVQKIEQKMLNYGASVLRLRASQRQAQAVDNPNTARGRDNQFLATLKSKFKSIFPCVFRNDNASRSNNVRSQKRAVLYMAIGYSSAWILTWIPFCVLFFIMKNKATRMLHAVLYPLQGLYNLTVYMSPKVRHARNTKRGKLPWREAIVKAWMSKGEEDMAIFGRRNSNTASMQHRLRDSFSRFADRRRRSFAALTYSKPIISGSAIIQPPSIVKQNQLMHIDRSKVKHRNYARNNSSNAFHSNVDAIDLSKDVLSHRPVIQSKQMQPIESEGSVKEKSDNDPCGDGNITRKDDALTNSNLLSYQSSRKLSSALDDDLSEH